MALSIVGPGGLKTLKSYRWSICAAAYDQNNG